MPPPSPILLESKVDDSTRREEIEKHCEPEAIGTVFSLYAKSRPDKRDVLRLLRESDVV